MSNEDCFDSDGGFPVNGPPPPGFAVNALPPPLEIDLAKADLFDPIKAESDCTGVGVTWPA